MKACSEPRTDLVEIANLANIEYFCSDNSVLCCVSALWMCWQLCYMIQEELWRVAESLTVEGWNCFSWPFVKKKKKKKLKKNAPGVLAKTQVMLTQWRLRGTVILWNSIWPRRAYQWLFSSRTAVQTFKLEGTGNFLYLSYYRAL